MSFPVIAAAMTKAFTAIGTYGSAITAGLGVAQTAITHQQMAGQADIMEQQNREANDRARRYMIEDYDQMTRAQQQEAAAAGQKNQETSVNARKAAATTQVAASQAGVSGLSVDALLGDIFGQEASIRDSVNQNLENTGQQIATQRTSIARGYETAINTRPQPQHPSLIGSALSAGSQIVGAYKDQWKVEGRGKG